MSETSTAPTTHPNFAFDDSDLTVCSSDNVLFRVHVHNLADHSSIFQDMLCVGQDAGSVPLQESSQTLAIIFAMCYPLREAPLDFSSLPAETILDCYEATLKYEMWVGELALRGFVE